MAATATVHKSVSLGDSLFLYMGTIALDNSALAAGEPIDVSANNRFERLIVTGGSGAANGYRHEWDSANQALKSYRTDQVDDAQEAVPDTTDLSALTALEFVAFGS
jgi:hypothetical protein